MNTSSTAQIKKRAPNGLERDKPIPVRLTAEERAKVQDMAEKESRSMASLLLMAARLGFMEYERNPRAFANLPHIGD